MVMETAYCGDRPYIAGLGWLDQIPPDSYENTQTGCFHAGEGAGTPAWTI